MIDSAMAAFSLSIAILAYWFVLGRALLWAAGWQRDRDSAALLIAPSIGLVVTVLPVFWASRWGLPARSFALPLTLGLLVAALAVWGWRWRRGSLELGGGGAFVATVMLAMVVVGWPSFFSGFDWLSFANDDMANYVLGADRLARQPFFAMPSLQVLKQGSDLPAIFWTIQVVDGARVGSELMLAWLMSVTGLDALQLVMPSMLALHGALISAAAALVLLESRSTRAAVIAGVALAINPLTVFATLSQLFAQLGGLSLVFASLAALGSPWDVPRSRWLAYVLPAAIVVAGLLLWYPELTPFLGIGFLLYLLVNVRRWSHAPLGILGLAVAVAAGVALCTGPYLADALRFLWIQFSGALPAGESRQVVFSYYLVWSGLPTLWGLQPIALPLPGALEPMAIAAAAMLSIIAVIVIGIATLGGQLTGCVTVVMIALAAVLFAKTADFGLYKLAMYVQPFLIATLVTFAATRAWRKTSRLSCRAILATAALLALCEVRTSVFYTRTASDMTTAAYYFTLKGMTPSHMASQLRRLVAPSAAPEFATDAQAMTMAKVVSHFAMGRPLHFLSASPFGHLLGSFYRPGTSAAKLYEAFLASIESATFAWPTTGAPDRVSLFPADHMAGDRNVALIRTPQMFSVLNGFSAPSDPAAVDVVPGESIRNFLSFQPTDLGAEIFAASDFDHVAIGQTEPDYFYPGHHVALVGRYLLFRAVNPDAAPRLVLTVTASQHINGRTDLPPAAVVGKSVVPLNPVGRGSARLVSGPIAARDMLGERFVGLDMGRAAEPAISTGGFDPRKLVAMVRDVSLISQGQYSRFTPPQEISSFPTDLANPNLEYSGLYEDGWVAERAFVRLAGSNAPATLHLDLEVPRFSPESPARELTVWANGQPILQRVLPPGLYWLRASLPPSPAAYRIDLKFSATERLPNNDGRPASARIVKVGWAPVTELPRSVVIGKDRFDASDIDPVGVWPDGWLAQSAELSLAGGGPAYLRLEGLLPLTGDPRIRSALTISVNGEDLARHELAPGNVTLDVPLPASGGPRRVRLAFSQTQRLSANDPREAAMRLDRIEIVAKDVP